MHKAVWIAVLLAAVAYVAAAFATVDHRSDRARIDALIARGAQAVQKRDVTGVVSCISTDYKDDTGINYDRLRILLAQAMRAEGGYIVTTSTQSERIDGDQATVTLHVTLRHPDGVVFYDRKLALDLVNEAATHMLIVPTKSWRVVSSENLGLPTTESMF